MLNLKMLSISLVLLWTSSVNVFAGQVTIQKPLSFGKIALKNNNNIAVMQMTSSGQILKDNVFVIIEPGQPGELLLYDFPPSIQLTFSISPGVTTSAYSGGATATQFSIEPYLDFTTQTTNAQGELILKLPARLVTSGDGTNYGDGEYYRFFQLNIDY